jgi:hypothetical protein
MKSTLVRFGIRNFNVKLVKAKEKEPKVTDLFKEIKSLDGLKAYAQAAAWQKQTASGNTTDSLHDFLNKAVDKNDVSGVPNLDDFKLIGPAESHLLAGPPEPPHPTDWRAEPPPEPKPKPDTSDYEPLGVWIVNWAQLFPWPITGHDNAVTKGVKVLEWMRLRTLQQDCLSLTRLYDRLDGEGCSIKMEDGKTVDFGAIRDSFSHVAARIAGFLNTNPRPPVTDVANKIKSFLSQLSTEARKIYSTWDEVPQFRRCELGAGLAFEF